ncbi:Hemolysin A [Fusobacterium sp. DD29]|uniref:TlyA family RNA methyltransferase n=1 Tax=unclassified Fusobacterium TaxID=2648384 RepID=UPI001B8ADB26|nr:MULTISPECIES: TlyA family RNA methyltransferase [unclassified Fusobacterium]MBR8701195.1 Hemolysin A [Fusobacterium sp. DD45]MBR8710969.1 Hemolysin A [Fusobacterium sp. DD28]MBR8749942.1 Hemolysin A [Fusobacterium sp. DD29]MBR8751543.1 Hemolysin A [Fusobacterium sp. DD26]MBR8762184.1 Hemolysin A [Fusobacterium sp. DD25]
MKERLDVLLVKRGFFPDKDKAKRAVMAGLVVVNDKRIDKSGTMIKTDEEPVIRIKGDNLKYVSRGGLKLEKAVEVFSLNFSGKKVLDVGASTGGFTDCALQNGAEFVYSVDVGTNQLDWKLRSNPQVKSIENRHINDLTSDEIDGSTIDYIVMDVSFISIKKVLPDLLSFFSPHTKLMALIKPQFEAKKEDIAKGGIVKDENVHLEIIEDIVGFAREHGLYLENLDFSPITGTKGNVEYISLFGVDSSKEKVINIKDIVSKGKNLGGTI